MKLVLKFQALILKIKHLKKKKQKKFKLFKKMYYVSFKKMLIFVFCENFMSLGLFL